MQFESNYERDYTPEQAAQYLADIKTYIVPLFKQLFESGELYAYEDGPLDTGRLEGVLEAGVRSIGGEAEETFDFMKKYGMYDIAYSINKSNMSFQTYLDDYESPFLFMDAGGTLDDITTFSHEFGHYLDGYLNYGAEETIDLAECFSQAMELLMMTRLDRELSGEELENLYQIKMLDILNMYVQQAAFAEFEHRVYSMEPEELTEESINQLFLQLSQDYGFCEAGFESLYSKLWIDITHFFEQPFYVITYPVSNDLALQIYELELEAPGAGLEKFGEMLPRDSANMLEIASAAGLQSPFAPGRILKAAEDIRGILNEEALAA
jgi:oligoendopeptidase F